MSPGSTTETFGPSRFLLRALDRNRHVDYVLAFAIGAWPILLSYLLGAHRTIAGHEGYWDSPNWWSLAILLPLLLFAFRFLMARVIPVGSAQVPASPPPIVELLRDASNRQRVYADLRRCVLSRWNVRVPLAATLIVHLLDAPSTLAPYYGGSAVTSDWVAMFLVTPEISTTENLVLLVSATTAQFVAVFIGMLAIVLFFRHNLFFLGNIYQRRWVPAGEEGHFFQIDPQDVNRCFGFRVANVAFNAQVQALMIAGAAMFLSRYAHVIGNVGADTETRRPLGEMLAFSTLFPLPSQWLMALSWLVALTVVAMPAVVKLLPRIPGHGAGRANLSISNYLREFFSDQAWPKDRNGRDEPYRVVAARFARNSFWPTGDNRAGLLFFFAYWIFFVTLLPAPAHAPWLVLANLVVFAVLAYLARLATFAALRLSLHYVDELLVIGSPEEDHPLDAVDPHGDRFRDRRVFVSYRRRDSAPYARSLNERLTTEFRPDGVFMDIATIGPGENFVQRIDRALEQVDAVIVLIGKSWLTATKDGENRRIDDPADMVHMEIATALRADKHVIPVLVGGASMPGKQQLPGPLQGLAQLNAIELSDTRWDYDLGRLIAALRQ